MNPLELFASRNATLRSPLGVEACAERLGGVTDGLFNLLGTRPMIGSVNGHSLSARRRLNYRNSFQTAVNATLEPSGSGTTIHCRFGVLTLVKVFMGIWLLMAALASVGAVMVVLTGPAPDGSAAFALMPIFFVLFGLAMITVGRWFARKDESILLEIVRAATDATVVDRDPGYEPVDRGTMEATAEALPAQRLLMFIILGVVLALGVAGFVVSQTGLFN